MTAFLASLAAASRLGVAQSAAPQTAAPSSEDAPKTVEESIKQVRQNSEALRNLAVPMSEEPAFSFQV